MKPINLPIQWHYYIFRLPVGFHPMAETRHSGKIQLAMKTKNKSAQPEAGATSPPFEFTIRQRGAKAAPKPKAEKRDNIFSKSRDTREDRGERQIKTANNPQTLPHIR